MLRLEQKWRIQLPTQSDGSKRTKVSATGAYSSSSNPETPLADEPSVDSPVCPQGSNKSKRKGKKREEEREHRAKIMAIKEKELQIQAAMKEKELQAQAAMKEQELKTQRYIKEMEEQELKTQRYIKEMEINAKEREMERMAKEREREMDMQILNADTSTMSEKL
ncbi:hypothetical protein Ahy_A10g047325 [Arachis hypogaea]|uniref:No apical meristem-associated C-terminal domain-containing protein n=1 Tax=Arachis hypogaea TaxID=3818 RepID=A0A445B283_ARAHY|nr:hypothetical protein Ahy_A10g047325 [Arachis hypogaea]